MSTTLITPPALEVVQLTELKAQLRLDGTAEDAFLQHAIDVATEGVQTATGRQLLTATWDAKFDRWPSGRVLALPYPPLQSVTSVTYYDLADVAQTFAATNYLVDTTNAPGRVILKQGACWPVNVRDVLAVTVRFVAGYGAAGTSVPAGLRQAVLLWAAHLYEHREAYGPLALGSGQVPLGLEAYLGQYQFGWGIA